MQRLRDIEAEHAKLKRMCRLPANQCQAKLEVTGLF